MLGFETWKFYIQVISFDTHLDLFIKSLISNSPNTLWNWPISTQRWNFYHFFPSANIVCVLFLLLPQSCKVHWHLYIILRIKQQKIWNNCDNKFIKCILHSSNMSDRKDVTERKVLTSTCSNVSRVWWCGSCGLKQLRRLSIASRTTSNSSDLCQQNKRTSIFHHQM